MFEKHLSKTPDILNKDAGPGFYISGTFQKWVKRKRFVNTAVLIAHGNGHCKLPRISIMK